VGEIYFRHERPRPYQSELMGDVSDAISHGKIILANAPTGSGKTDAALSAAITHAISEDLTVFFLTPKISQHRIAMDVVRGIADRHDIKLRAVDLVGRRNACLEQSLLELDHEGFYQACEKRRKKNQCIYYRKAKGSGRIEEAKADMLFAKMLKNYGSGKYHGELMATSFRMKACPYEWMIKLGNHSNVIIADYMHFMMPDIRASLLQKMKKDISRSIVIVDEAHNLGKRVREHLSLSMNSHILGRAEKELRYMKKLRGSFAESFDDWAKKRLKDSSEKLVSKLGFSNFAADIGGTVDDAVAFFGEAGLEFMEETGKKSACMKVSRFIAGWQDEDDASVRILRRKGTIYSLSKRFLDPSKATGVLNGTVSSILMSGTLLPLEMHRDVLGLDKDRIMMKSYPSPFDTGSILNIITDGITTKFSKRGEKTYRRIADKVERITERTPGGVAVFFPSYSLMNSVLPFMDLTNAHIQREGMNSSEVKGLIDMFSDKGGILIGVQGGSMSEGVDFPDGQIKTAVIVGIALDEMSLEAEAIIDYYDDKFGKGWDYGYLYPGTIKALQAAGRGRRKESDRLAVVYMDERFRWDKYNWIFNPDEDTVMTSSPEEAVSFFFGNR
jgi:DNA excision repair protein ERCC-2